MEICLHFHPRQLIERFDDVGALRDEGQVSASVMDIRGPERCGKMSARLAPSPRDEAPGRTRRDEGGVGGGKKSTWRRKEKLKGIGREGSGEDYRDNKWGDSMYSTQEFTKGG